MTDSDPEIEYLRKVEDLFASLRSVPHILSPKDVQLIRSWWRDQVPLTAVSAGVSEVVERRKASGDEDPVVSLSYCRHAVKRHARRLAELRVGATPESAQGERLVDEGDLSRLVRALETSADACRGEYPRSARVIEDLMTQVRDLEGLAAAEADERLYALETALLDGCRRSLPKTILGGLEEEARQAALASGAVGAAARRAETAFFDRLLRRFFDLPRLEAP